MKQYIDKFAVIAELEKIYVRNRSNGYFAFCEDIDDILSFIDTLEVKKVDLDKEINCKDVIIEKACELLARMIWEVTYEDLEGNSVQHYDKMEFIEDFKTYMKGE